MPQLVVPSPPILKTQPYSGIDDLPALTNIAKTESTLINPTTNEEYTILTSQIRPLETNFNPPSIPELLISTNKY